MFRSLSVVVFLSVAFCVAVIAKLDVITEDKVEYKFFPFTNKSAHFKIGAVYFQVKAANDVHIGLTTEPLETDPMIEVVIGGWSNTNSVIRRRFKTLQEKVTIETHGILSRSEFRGFWISWDKGVIAVGREGAEAPFMSWMDPDPFTITHVGVHTGYGSTGSWIIEDPAPAPVIAPHPNSASAYLDNDQCCKCCNKALLPLGYTTSVPAFTNAIELPNRRRDRSGSNQRPNA